MRWSSSRGRPQFCAVRSLGGGIDVDRTRARVWSSGEEEEEEDGWFDEMKLLRFNSRE